MGEPLRRSLAIRGAGQALHLKRHQALGREADHLAQQIGVRGLFQQRAQGHHVVGHRGSVRAKVEHPFLYVKRHFGYAKVRYRGVAKNRQRIALLLGFSNLLIAGRYATG